MGADETFKFSDRRLSSGDRLVKAAGRDAECGGGALERGLVCARRRIEIGAGAHVRSHRNLQRFRRRRRGAFRLTKRAFEGERRCRISDDIGRLFYNRRVAVEQRIGALIDGLRGRDWIFDPRLAELKRGAGRRQGQRARKSEHAQGMAHMMYPQTMGVRARVRPMATPIRPSVTMRSISEPAISCAAPSGRAMPKRSAAAAMAMMAALRNVSDWMAAFSSDGVGLVMMLLVCARSLSAPGRGRIDSGAAASRALSFKARGLQRCRISERTILALPHRTRASSAR